jgi:hypothetical protein
VHPAPDSSDPFFKIHTDFSAEPFYKSETLKATLNPEWQEFELDLTKYVIPTALHATQILLRDSAIV